MKVRWLKDDSDGWISGDLIQLVTMGPEVLAAVVLPITGRIAMIEYSKLRVGGVTELNENPEGGQ